MVVSRKGRPLVRITQLAMLKRVIKFGLLKGRLRIASDFDAPLPNETLGLFEGR